MPLAVLPPGDLSQDGAPSSGQMRSDRRWGEAASPRIVLASDP